MLAPARSRVPLCELAGREVSRPRRRAAQKAQRQLRTVLDDLGTTPAMILGRYLDVLAWNPMATALFSTDFGKIPERQRNRIRLLFTDPMVKSLFADWENSARYAVAVLRRRAVAHPDDLGLTTLVGELSVQDDRFRQWWAGRQVARRTGGTNVFKPASNRAVSRRHRRCWSRWPGGCAWTTTSAPTCTSSRPNTNTARPVAGRAPRSSRSCSACSTTWRTRPRP
ncbi:hypothetical protein [Streptomyces ipomoeae]|uniref:MmyB family transcriptional regulator n=1 Tax=Streptomyces ipomoeae TaxID=103232 RepID=UPI0029C02225|nr:hypothetical protein [Streptomyces ipomoeae]